MTRTYSTDDKVPLSPELDRMLDMMAQSIRQELRLLLCQAYLDGKSAGMDVAERALDRAFEDNTAAD